ncbi:hypothetical protein [Amycolatopsis sp. CA-230715]|uniref:hypothetical protein n=1 Tax=Amycolatopsis sp. CA-230715 TaxID=2745196 RepID=UPI001C00BE1B|nr:hypothetical protein [Amycolatopsis sp. CA-230715]QWF85657.1 hypothetical protein HUW46_09112 [Amycolatopsis sp. CA-230715]
MGIKDTAAAFGRRFKLDSHHAIERFGVLVGIFALTGVIVIGGAVASAIHSDTDALSRTALYTTSFTTSKTHLKGTVDGVYTNSARDRALVVMHFPASARMSFNAADYQAFLLGSDANLASEPVSTRGITGSVHVFGSTGYVGVLLQASEPFGIQVLNLTIRANAELAYTEPKQSQRDEGKLADDASFREHDQWRIFVNPGASGARQIPALDSARFDPARAYYDVALSNDEQAIRGKLDQKLLSMRANLTQIQSYTTELATTKVDGLFLKPPPVPAGVAGDTVTGVSSAEAKNGVSTLTLDSRTVVPGGVTLNWRAGNVYAGYLSTLVPPGQSHAEFLAKKHSETTGGTLGQQISSLPWILSDGSNLKTDYRTSDVTMRPLVTIMNSLSQAYQDYAKGKSEYQTELLLDLLRLDAKLRDVQANSSLREGTGVLRTLY